MDWNRDLRELCKSGAADSGWAGQRVRARRHVDLLCECAQLL
jgi:hypothetical protein